MDNYLRYITDIILPGLTDTIVILLCTMIITGTIGFVIGAALYIFDEDGLKPCPKIHAVLSVSVNIMRSIPSVIFIIFLMPLARTVIGSALGIQAAILYLSIMCCSFVGRIVDEKLKKVDASLVDAVRSMGISNTKIFFCFVVHEAVPSLVLGYTFATIVILGVIAVAGLVGAGGIGTVALNYGYYAFNDFVMYGSVFVMFLLTIGIQLLGRIVSHKLR